MKKHLILLPFFLIISLFACCQSLLVSGPWAGNVDLRTATIWCEVSPAATSVMVKYWTEELPKEILTRKYTGTLGNESNPIKLSLTGLKMNSHYRYNLLINGKIQALPFETGFTTKELWQYRKPAPDFNFLAGSCSYFNDPPYDRPGKPYGMDSSIFTTMAGVKAAFNLWLGDGWYTREVDYNSTWGLNARVARDRAMKVIQPFMAAMPQYYIWDDHDYGPNNSGKSYLFKEASRAIFREYTLNPNYGEEGKGIYTKVSYSDVDLFLTDDRYFRSESTLEDSVSGKPNPGKTYFGPQQMDWLKNALLYSTATFKIIATGSQVLNPLSGYECLRFYTYEYNELMQFLERHNVSGVVFLSGDRHHSEVIKLERPRDYPLYDITVSPLTATVSKVKGAEVNNLYRVKETLVEAQNFANIEVTGNKNERKLKVSFRGLAGQLLGEWSVGENELKNRR